MTSQVRPPKKMLTALRYLVFAISLLLLIGSWVTLWWQTALATEALLVPWHCCGWNIQPAIGTWQRTLNDFFETTGSELPSLIFILASGSIFAVKSWRAKNRTWLPLLFFLGNLIFFAAHLLAITLSWKLSNWVIGPRLGGIDNGYHRTWYGIVGTLLLWITFWISLIRLPIGKQANIAKQMPAHS